MSGSASAFEADFSTMKASDRYKLLCGLVVPRPIALATTLGPGGIVNAAPFSFFNTFGEEPPLVVLGVQSRKDHSPKDTANNIRETGSFVVNLVDEALAERMNVCAVDFPPDVSELTYAQLTTTPSVKIPVPRLAEAPAALECRHFMSIEVSRGRKLCVGEVLYVHARGGIVDPAKLYVDMTAYKPIARLAGHYYARLTEPFTMVRKTYAEWLAEDEAAPQGGNTVRNG